ncbi:MAG: hypothetical protein ACR2P0_09210 [Acidimicrobiales bacterium]
MIPTLLLAGLVVGAFGVARDHRPASLLILAGLAIVWGIVVYDGSVLRAALGSGLGFVNVTVGAVVGAAGRRMVRPAPASR